MPALGLAFECHDPTSSARFTYRTLRRRRPNTGAVVFLDRLGGGVAGPEGRCRLWTGGRRLPTSARHRLRLAGERVLVTQAVAQAFERARRAPARRARVTRRALRLGKREQRFAHVRAL